MRKILANIIIKLRLTLTCQGTSIYSSSVWGDKLGQQTNILYVQSELDKYTVLLCQNFVVNSLQSR